MKNKKIGMTFIAVIFTLLLVLASRESADTAKDALTLHSEVGKMFHDYYKAEPREGDVYAVGKNTIISKEDIEQAVEFYIIAGLKEDDARKKAEQYVFGQEALYYKAIQEGYQVTDEEVHNYIEQCKVELETLSNRDEIEAIIAQYDSEEEYWNHQFVVYQKDLPIMKYLKDLEKEFWNGKKEQSYDSSALNDEDWVTYYNSFRDNLIEEEDYQLIGK